MIVPTRVAGWRKIIKEFFPDMNKYAAVYKDLHQNPDLPCQESRTAGVIAHHLDSLGYETTKHIGGHGLVGILKNGAGITVLLRSELDALPLKEETGLSYTSKKTQVDADGQRKHVMHGCGHDLHMASLLATAELLAQSRKYWSGTLICLFQPNEERLLGAQAMIDDGLFDKIPMPHILLGQHAVPTKAGTIGTRPGRVLAYLDSLEVRVYGKSTHSSTPDLGIDPILIASCIVARLQTIVAREIDAKEPCVVACGMFQAGTDASIIPEYADFKVDIRAWKKDIQAIALAAVRRIVEGECQTANSPRRPRIRVAASCPPIDNDLEATNKVTDALRSFYGDGATDKILTMDLDMTADDFVLLGHPPKQKSIPYVYWNIGAIPREQYDRAAKAGTLRQLPSNHNSKFAPELEPSLRAGIEGMAIASLAFLTQQESYDH